MNEPNYILKDTEAVWVPKDKNSFLNVIRRVVFAVLVILLIGSFVFRNNLFREMNWATRILLVAVCAGTLFIGGREKVPSPFEIWFYDDYLVLFRDKHYYSNKVTRREYDRFFYKDIKQIQYRMKTHRLNIFGIVEGIWYDYNKDGTVPLTPTYQKTTDSIAYFYTDFLENTDIVSVLEQHSPIKVTIENS